MSSVKILLATDNPRGDKPVLIADLVLGRLRNPYTIATFLKKLASSFDIPLIFKAHLTKQMYFGEFISFSWYRRILTLLARSSRTWHTYLDRYHGDPSCTGGQTVDISRFQHFYRRQTDLLETQTKRLPVNISADNHGSETCVMQ